MTTPTSPRHINAAMHQAPMRPLQGLIPFASAPAAAAPAAAGDASPAQANRSPRVKSGREETEDSLQQQPPAKRARLDETPAFTSGQAQAGTPMPPNQHSDAPSNGMHTSDAKPLPAVCAAGSHMIVARDEAWLEFDKCRQAADQGDATAQCRLARMYYEGRGRTEYPWLATFWYEKAANQGNIEAQQALGSMSLEGLGRQSDPRGAIEWYRSAVGSLAMQLEYDKGLSASREKRIAQAIRSRKDQLIEKFKASGDAAIAFELYLTGCDYQAGTFVEAQIDTAIALYRLAARGGSAEACRALAQLYSQGLSVKPDRREALHWHCAAARCMHEQARIRPKAKPAPVANAMDAFDLQQDLAWCREAAKRGQAAARSCLALAHYWGTGVETNMEEAYRLASEAAHQGHDFGQFLLGLLYLGGHGVKKDEKLAEEWLRKAAQQGDSNAQFALGEIWFRAEVNAKPASQARQESVEVAGKAIDMLLRAARSGHAAAQRTLASCYVQGIGTAPDLLTARSWLERAAKQGETRAQFCMGDWLERRQDDAAPLRKALDWYRKAAAKGLPEALCALGRLYLNGIGVTRDVAAAFEFLSSAAKGGDRQAAAQLGVLYQGRELGPPNYKEAMHWLLESCKGNRGLHLKFLGLQTSQIHDLAERIGAAHSWRVLDLSGNGLSDEAATGIARLIRRDTRLHEIWLSNNSFTAKGLREIAQAMRDNISLIKLEIGSGAANAQPALARRINDACARNATLSGLLAQWEKADLEGAKYAVPTDVVHPLGQALIFQDQKIGATAVSVEATRLRLATLLLSLEELEVARPWEQ